MTTAPTSQKTEAKPTTADASTTTPSATPRKRSTGMKVLAGVLALVLLGGGAGIGIALSNPTQSSAYKKLSDDNAALQLKFEKSRAAFMSMDGKYAALQTALDEKTTELRVAEGKLEAAKK